MSIISDMDTTPGKCILAVVATWAIMMIVPFPIYGGFAALSLVEMPQQDSPGEFFLGVVVQKIGVALGFVLLFVLAKSIVLGRTMQYAAVWRVMYAIVETGQGVGPGYAGMRSQASYRKRSTFHCRRGPWVGFCEVGRASERVNDAPLPCRPGWTQSGKPARSVAARETPVAVLPNGLGAKTTQNRCRCPPGHG